MKITSSTSITSMSGTMLISASGCASPVFANPPKAMASGARLQHGGTTLVDRAGFFRGALPDRRSADWLVAHEPVADVRTRREKGEQVVREGIELREHHAVRTHQ